MAVQPSDNVGSSNMDVDVEEPSHCCPLQYARAGITSSVRQPGTTFASCPLTCYKSPVMIGLSSQLLPSLGVWERIWRGLTLVDRGRKVCLICTSAFANFFIDPVAVESPSSYWPFSIPQSRCDFRDKSRAGKVQVAIHLMQNVSFRTPCVSRKPPAPITKATLKVAGSNVYTNKGLRHRSRLNLAVVQLLLRYMLAMDDYVCINSHATEEEPDATTPPEVAPQESLAFLDTHPFVKQTVVDKIYGCIAGSALGDTIGLYSEFLTKAQSAVIYPKRKFQLVEPATELHPDGHRSTYFSEVSNASAAFFFVLANADDASTVCSVCMDR